MPWTGAHKLKFTVTKDAGAPKPSLEWPVCGAADDERADDRSLDQRRTGVTATAQLDSTTGPDPLQGQRDGCGPDPERAGRAAVDERRREPGELHGDVLELRQRAARLGAGRRRRDAEDRDHGPGRARRLACSAGRPERSDQGAGPVLREAELRLDPEDGQGRASPSSSSSRASAGRRSTTPWP